MLRHSKLINKVLPDNRLYFAFTFLTQDKKKKKTLHGYFGRDAGLKQADLAFAS